VVLAICVTYRDRGFFSRAPILIPGEPGKPAQYPNGPRGRLLTGNLSDLDAHGRSAMGRWWDLHKTYGPAYELSVPFFRLVVINHPKYMEYIQKTNFNNFIKGYEAKRNFHQLQRDGIFTSDGQAWYTQRKAAAKAFTKKNFENHITTVLHRHLEILLKLLKRLADERTAFDFQDVMSRLLVCSTIQILFHVSTGMDNIFTSEPSCLHEICEFTEAFDKAQYLFDERRRNSLWPWTERLSGKDKLTGRAVDLIYGYMNEIIEERLQQKSPEDKQDHEGKGQVDLLDLFMQSTRDKDDLAGMCVNFLLAGRDTTAYSIAWFLLEILRPENTRYNLVQRARDDIQTTGVNEYLDYGESAKLKFLNAIWNEVLRLDPVAPAGQLEVAADDVLPAVPEMNIPARPVRKGDCVVWHNYILSRMPELWGPDAEDFKPDRWFNEDGQLQQPSPFNDP